MLNFFDTIPLPTIVVNKENNIIFINSIGLHFLELSAIDINSQSILSIFPELYIDALRNKEEFSTPYFSSTGVKIILNIQFDSCILDATEYRLLYIKEFTKPKNLFLYSEKKID